MPKKQPRGAFFFFLLDYKKMCERNGETFPDGIRNEDLKLNAGEEWKLLSPQDKNMYEDMAKEEKLRTKGNRETNMHRSFSSVDLQRKEEDEDKANMHKWIEGKISAVSSTKLSLAEEKFYLIHANYFCVSVSGTYHPAELALAEFSLAKGVSGVLHKIIDTGTKNSTIPLGYTYDAIQKSEKVHKIPLGYKDGETDFQKLFTEIKQFLEPGRRANGGEYPPLFTMPDNVTLNTSMSCVKSIIATLCSITNEESPEQFPVYPLDKLFFELKNASNRLCNGVEYPQMSFAQRELNKDVYNFTMDLACSFHACKDAAQVCSKSYVQRWIYLICDHCCQFLDIELGKGRPDPLKADTNFIRRAKELEKDGTRKDKKENTSLTWINLSKSTHLVSHEPAPLRQKPNLGAMPPRPQLGNSEDDFPPISLGRGRGALLLKVNLQGNN